MASRTWLPFFLVVILGCGESSSTKPIGDSSAPPAANTIGIAGNGGNGGNGGGGSGGSGATVGAPGDPAPGLFYSVGDILTEEQLSWKGYTEKSDELGTISLSDYYDPTGALGIRALLLTEGQADCGPCVAEAKDLAQNLAGKWKDQGIKVIQLLVSDVYGAPASSEVAMAWKNKVHASWAVGMDPNFTFSQIGSNPFPIQIIVDPRTLTITHRIEGYRAKLPELEALAEKNKQ